MKVLAALFALLLGAAVFVVFLRPWDEAGKPSAAKAPEAAPVAALETPRRPSQAIRRRWPRSSTSVRTCPATWRR